MKKKLKESLSGSTTEINFLGTKTYLNPSPPIKFEKNKVIDGDFSSSIDDYLEKKKNEIPLYDPQTGEPNPYYEELTGKKNPLLTTPKTLNPNTRELRFKNRFLVYLPKELGIEPWDIKSIKKPITTFNPFTKEINYSDVKLSFNDFITNNNNNLLTYLKNQVKFSFKIEEVDPTGAVIETTDFDGCFINQIDFGFFDYKSSEINQIMLDININNITIR